MPEVERNAMLRFVRMMATAMDAGDPFTHGRAYRCSKYARSLGRRLGFDESSLSDLEYAGLLQDLGKKAILYGILQKPGPLSADERSRMATHAQISADALSTIPFLEGASVIVASLNERFDGEGRPRGLAGTGIPLASRVLAVVSAFDAMTSDRPYRAGLSAEEAYAELRAEAGSRFDPEAVEAIIALHESGELFSEFDPAEVLLYANDGCRPPGLESRPDLRVA